MSQTRVEDVIDRLVRRLRLVRSLGSLVRFAPVAAAVLCLGLIRDKFTPLPAAAWTVLLWTSALIVVAGPVAGCLRRVSRRGVAKLADVRLGLDDRLSSAVEFLASASPTAFMQAHVRETERHLDRVRPVEAVPFRMPRGLWLVCAAFVVSGVLAIVPGFAGRVDVADVRAEKPLPPMRFAGEKTVDAALARLDRVEDRRLVELMRELKRLYADVRAGELTRDETLRRAGEVEVQLDEARSRHTGGQTAHTWRKELEKALADKGKTLEQHPATSNLGRALAQLKLDEASKESRSLAGRLDAKPPTLKLTPEQSKALAKIMEQAAGKNPRSLDVLSKHLNDAARSLTLDDMKQLAENLERIARELEELDKDAERMGDLARIDEELEELRNTVGALKRDENGKWVFSLAPGGEGGAGFFRLEGELPKDEREDGEPGVGDTAEGPGTGGEPTRLDAQHKPSLVGGKWGDGASLIEIVHGAASEGVATAEYREVVEAARRLAEDAVHAEDIPLGYRLYIKRYFQLIRPREDAPKENP
ncbi:MAG TPA: hypothetical protein VMX57_06240 [Planctomycetota bacterium]|nr:hypothetical protein [Planctomycetota bacterium]